MVSSLTSADTKIYGMAHIGLTKESGSSGLKLKDRDSYIGLRGVTPLDNGLLVTYKFDIGVNFTDRSLGDSPYVHYSFAGLKGKFGELRLGRQYSAYNIVDNSMNDFLTHQANGLVSDSDTENLVAFIRKLGDVAFYASHIPATEATNANTSFMLNYALGSVYTGFGFFKEAQSKEHGMKFVLTYKKDHYGFGFIHEKCPSRQNITAAQVLKGECSKDGVGSINHASGSYSFGKTYVAAQIAKNSGLDLQKTTLELGSVLNKGTKAYIELDKTGSQKSATLGLKTAF